MNWHQSRPNLNFDRRLQRIPGKLIVVIGALVAFAILWRVVPTTGLFWLLAITITALAWIATFGWRQALTALIAFLHRLEQF